MIRLSGYLLSPSLQSAAALVRSWSKKKVSVPLHQRPDSEIFCKDKRNHVLSCGEARVKQYALKIYQFLSLKAVFGVLQLFGLTLWDVFTPNVVTSSCHTYDCFDKVFQVFIFPSSFRLFLLCRRTTNHLSDQSRLAIRKHINCLCVHLAVSDKKSRLKSFKGIRKEKMWADPATSTRLSWKSLQKYRKMIQSGNIIKCLTKIWRTAEYPQNKRSHLHD